MRGIQKQRTLLIFLLILLVLLPFCSSGDVETFGIVKKDNSILLKQNCVNVTSVNITSISVHGEITREMLNESKSMTLVYNGYQTYNFTNNSVVGEYIVTGVCNENGDVKSWSYNYFVTPSGTNISTVQISIYIFFLLLCISFLVFSALLFHKNKLMNDKLSYSDMYQIKKRNELEFYGKLIKRKMWIFGLFGIYLSLLLFISIFGQLLYNLGVSDLFNVVQWFIYILAYGLIPFGIFWICWLIITVYWGVQESLKYQFGGVLRRDKNG